MISKANLQSYREAFDNFMLDTDVVESAILKSTESGFEGSGYSLELFENGSSRILWDNSIGNLYCSPGIIISIPQLTDEDYKDEYFDDAITELEDNLEEILDRVTGWPDDI